jgi:DNA invertase Pin-like site-specific DNA recombinase
MSDERNMISSRTKSALEAAKRRGTKLGNPHFEEAMAIEARQRLANDRNTELRRTVAEVMDKTGPVGCWSASALRKRLL